MTELDVARLVDLAACLSLSATTPDACDLATRKRQEATAAIELEQEKLDKLRATLALFPLVIGHE